MDDELNGGERTRDQHRVSCSMHVLAQQADQVAAAIAEMEANQMAVNLRAKTRVGLLATYK